MAAEVATERRVDWEVSREIAWERFVELTVERDEDAETT
jgi:hypothetical protein